MRAFRPELSPSAVGPQLGTHYKIYRYHQASVLSAVLGCFYLLMAWIFLPLENQHWQNIRRHHHHFFPHIDSRRPRPLDIVRYAIQSVWLLITKTPSRMAYNFALIHHAIRIHHRIIAAYDKLFMRLSAQAVTLKDEAASQQKDEHLTLRWITIGTLSCVALVIAILCITQPFNPAAQFVFWLILWG